MASNMTRTHAHCSGCSLCLLVCPVWRATRDIRHTPHGRAKALQHGATAADLAPAIDSCTMCGACEPVCPENIPLLDLIAGLRKSLVRGDATADDAEPPAVDITHGHGNAVLVPDRALGEHAALLASAMQALDNGAGVRVAADAGLDIAHALELGSPISPRRLNRFLDPLRPVSQLIVADGLLLRAMRIWLPHATVIGVGEALSKQSAIRSRLKAGDLYVIEARAYHASQARLVTHYDNLRVERGCTMNLDLQRMAIPTTVGSRHSGLVDAADQARWIMEGHAVLRIVVEAVDDLGLFRKVTDTPVVYLAELG